MVTNFYLAFTSYLAITATAVPLATPSKRPLFADFSTSLNMGLTPFAIELDDTAVANTGIKSVTVSQSNDLAARDVSQMANFTFTALSESNLLNDLGLKRKGLFDFFSSSLMVQADGPFNLLGITFNAGPAPDLLAELDKVLDGDQPLEAQMSIEAESSNGQGACSGLDAMITWSVTNPAVDQSIGENQLSTAGMGSGLGSVASVQIDTHMSL